MQFYRATTKIIEPDLFTSSLRIVVA
jgi:hypothetical protein